MDYNDSCQECGVWGEEISQTCLTCKYRKRRAKLTLIPVEKNCRTCEWHGAISDTAPCARCFREKERIDGWERRTW